MDANTPHTPTAARLVQQAPSAASNDVPVPARNAARPPTPGFEPGEPRLAATYKPQESELDFVDRVHHDEIVAIAIQKGFDAGLKTGRNEGFREGLDAGTKAGGKQGCEEGSNEGVDAAPSMSHTTATPARLATSIEDIDADLLAHIRKTAEDEGWEEGCDAGTVLGRARGYQEGYDAAKCERRAQPASQTPKPYSLAMLDAIIYKKNLVPSRQRAYQASHEKLWYRPAHSRVYMGLYKTGFTIGMMSIGYSVFMLIKGKN
ncbi:hypothetical protein EWM64_g9306 [Hericium alpestre]|uniref:Essential protein Yae1 N-terminal domain-containing protein n=1 Tax=Hericium alpestre TaxID=135208 RepID=A0A4Y9ZIU2_9AGAM|nr:hypothetical protein EWM64_g9306 [Hericium alpestre]